LRLEQSAHPFTEEEIMVAPRSVPLSAHELCESIRQSLPYDAARLDRVLRVDMTRALVEVQPNTPWKSLASQLRPSDAQARELRTTCASVGESIAWNAAGPDGRPSVMHVESLTMVTPDGQLRRIDRITNPTLFALVVGGHGLFGALYSVTLRLESLARAVSEAQAMPASEANQPRRELQLLVPPEQVEGLLADANERCTHWRIALKSLAVRRIHQEDETFLRWAPREYAEVGIGLVEQATLGSTVRMTQLRRELIDVAIARGGAFPIACTPEATRAQTETCYPQLASFLAEQRRIDPRERWANAWSRHQRSLLGRETCEVRWNR
jgi:FAD/FMN-containing dehydrogenase